MTGVGDHKQGLLDFGHDNARDLSAGQVGNAPILMFAQWFTDAYNGEGFSATVPWSIDDKQGEISISVSSVSTEQPHIASQTDARFLMCVLSKAASIAKDNGGVVPEKVRISVLEYSKATAQARSTHTGRELIKAVGRLRNSRVVTDIRDDRTGAETHFSWISEATINYRYRYVEGEGPDAKKRREQMLTSFDITIPEFLRRLVHADVGSPLRPYQVGYFQIKSPTLMRLYDIANSGPEFFKIRLNKLHVHVGGSTTLPYFKRNTIRAFRRHLEAETSESADILPGFSVYIYGRDESRSLHWLEDKPPKGDIWFYFERSGVQKVQREEGLEGVPEYQPQLSRYEQGLVASTVVPNVREGSMT
jgi:hypothetical protein